MATRLNVYYPLREPSGTQRGYRNTLPTAPKLAVWTNHSSPR